MAWGLGVGRSYQLKGLIAAISSGAMNVSGPQQQQRIKTAAASVIKIFSRRVHVLMVSERPIPKYDDLAWVKNETRRRQGWVSSHAL